jgi:hypothetical protein
MEDNMTDRNRILASIGSGVGYVDNRSERS